MGICVPKHVVCNWYNPSTGSPPNFVASTAPCVLQVFDESRARLVAGGTFFRSVDVGAHTNNIQVSSVWQVAQAGSPGFRDYTGGDTIYDVVRVRLTITTGSGSPFTISATETYYADQYGSDSTSGSPESTSFVWDVSAIGSLRTQLAASQLAIMPTIDVQYNPGGSPSTWTTALDASGLTEFSSNLSGGTSADSTNLGNYRTGPAFTMVYIKDSEINNADGSISELGETRYWNGACWKGHNPLLPDCEDPADVGSPEGSPRLFCELGPSSGC